MTKANKQEHKPKKDDFHLAMGTLKDPTAWSASTNTDAVADRDWFAANPGKSERPRMISPLEQQLTGLPAESTVTVLRLPNGVQARAFHGPPENNC
jgi:hypothetical protein